MDGSCQRAHDGFVKSCRELVRAANSLACVPEDGSELAKICLAELEKADRHVHMALHFLGRWQEAVAPPPVAGKPAQDRVNAARSGTQDAFTGDTRTIPLSKLISFLGVQGKQGVLTIHASDEVIDIVFDGGALIHASSDNAPQGFRLGEMLVSMGKISRQELEQFLSEHEGITVRLGTALESEGLVSREDLESVLVSQVQELFHRISRNDSAKFSFAEGLPTDVDRRIRINVDGLLLESARRRDEAPSSS